METTLLGLALPNVLKKIKELLIRQGFIVQTMPIANPVLLAYKEGGWLRRPRQLVIEIISENNNMTRINITAIINNNNDTNPSEKYLEENFTFMLYRVFNNVNQKPNGI